MPYALWGLHPANLIDTYDREADALAEVSDLLDAGWSAEDLSLGQVGREGSALVIEGAMLAHLARQSGPDRRSGSM